MSSSALKKTGDEIVTTAIKGLTPILTGDLNPHYLNLNKFNQDLHTFIKQYLIAFELYHQYDNLKGGDPRIYILNQAYEEMQICIVDMIQTIRFNLSEQDFISIRQKVERWFSDNDLS
jgi:hypothetical protein